MKDETAEVVRRSVDAAPIPLFSAPADADFDAEKYRALADDFDISDEHASALLAALWSIMRMFVEMGFQSNICEQLFADSLDASAADSAIVKSPENGGCSP